MSSMNRCELAGCAQTVVQIHGLVQSTHQGMDQLGMNTPIVVVEALI